MANLSLTPADIIPSTTSFLRGTAGTAINAGDLIYKDSTGLLQLSDADGAAAAQAVDGIAVCSGADGQPINYVAEDADLEIGAGTSGTPYFLSATPGKICEAGDLAAGMKTIFVGSGKPGDKLNFKPVAGGIVPA
ncbi:MAG: hypothetical protein QOE70_5314 [Chthoniobacter sp.]|jgi:hypothetical protein|nr:hypothetical protein [Chthoniobacter sp.]